MAPASENAPGATAFADVIVTPGNFSDVRLSQLPVAALIEVVVVASAASDKAALASAPAARRRVVDIWASVTRAD